MPRLYVTQLGAWRHVCVAWKRGNVIHSRSLIATRRCDLTVTFRPHASPVRRPLPSRTDTPEKWRSLLEPAFEQAIQRSRR